MSTRLRLFVALYPPPLVAQTYLAHIKSFLDAQSQYPFASSSKLVPESQMHLTLQFVGDIDHRQLDETIESVKRAAAGCALLECIPHSLVLHPFHGPVRLIALQLACPPIMRELHARLTLRLARRPVKKSSKGYGKKSQSHQPLQPTEHNDEIFWPHMTLARFSPASPHRDELDQIVAATGVEEVSWPRFTASSIMLMQSVMTLSGARHSELARIYLTKL